MAPLPRPLFYLICASLCISTISLIFAILIIRVSLLSWIFPIAFILTTLYHGVAFLMSNSASEIETPDSSYLFSLPNLASAYLLTVLWTAVFGTAIALTVLVSSIGQLHAPRGLWSVIIPSVSSFMEALVMGSIAVLTHKERKRIIYASKWKWRPGHGVAASSQWSISNQPLVSK